MLKSLILVMMTAIFVNNYVFTRALGVPAMLDGSTKKAGDATSLSLAVLIVMVVSSAISWPLCHLVLDRLNIGYLNIVLECLIIAVIALLTEKVLSKARPALYSDMGTMFPLITVNSAVLALAAGIGAAETGFAQSLFTAIGCGLGFWLAALLFGGVRRKLEQADTPRCFKGLPIALIAAGIVSLALLGFAGVFETFLS